MNKLEFGSIAFFAICLSACKPSSVAGDAPIAHEPHLAKTVDEEAVTEGWRARGYRSLHLGGGNRFSISEEQILAAFHAECDARARHQPCAPIEEYRLDVVINERASVTFDRRHDLPRSDELEAFACINTAPGWRCFAEVE